MRPGEANEERMDPPTTVPACLRPPGALNSILSGLSGPDLTRPSWLSQLRPLPLKVMDRWITGGGMIYTWICGNDIYPKNQPKGRNFTYLEDPGITCHM